MGSLVDPFVAAGLHAILAATLWSGLIALAMVGARQPAQRCGLARVANLGLLALWPVVLCLPLPRVTAHDLLRTFDLALSPTVATTDTLPTVAQEPVIPEPVAARGPRWLRLAVGGYLAGALVFLSWLALGSGVAAWLVRGAKPPQETTRRIYARLPYGGWLGKPRLRVSDRVRQPVLVGTWRSTILIPPGSNGPSKPESWNSASRTN